MNNNKTPQCKCLCHKEVSDGMVRAFSHTEDCTVKTPQWELDFDDLERSFYE